MGLDTPQAANKVHSRYWFGCSVDINMPACVAFEPLWLLLLQPKYHASKQANVPVITLIQFRL
jgi:hypothetical protein